jgi:hypothetical protein
VSGLIHHGSQWGIFFFGWYPTIAMEHHHFFWVYKFVNGRFSIGIVCFPVVLRVSFIFPHWSIFFGENLSGQPHVKRWCLRRKHSGFSGGSGVAFLRLNLEAMAHFCYYFDALALRVVVFHSHVQLPEGHICGIGASIASWFFIQGWRRKKGKQWTSEVHLGWHLETMIWQKRDAKDFFRETAGI